MRASECPAAEPGVEVHAAGIYLLDHCGHFPVSQLPHVVVLAGSLARSRAEPAKEDVAGCLHQALPGYHTLTLIGVLRLTGVVGKDRRLGLLGLQQEGLGLDSGVEQQNPGAVPTLPTPTTLCAMSSRL